MLENEDVVANNPPCDKDLVEEEQEVVDVAVVNVKAISVENNGKSQMGHDSVSPTDGDVSQESGQNAEEAQGSSDAPAPSTLGRVPQARQHNDDHKDDNDEKEKGRRDDGSHPSPPTDIPLSICTSSGVGGVHITLRTIDHEGDEEDEGGINSRATAEMVTRALVNDDCEDLEDEDEEGESVDTEKVKQVTF